MATITPVQSRPLTGGAPSNPSVILSTWGPIGDADTCLPVEVAGFADQTVTIAGTSNGATVVLQGSNDGLNWFTLSDHLGNSVVTTSSLIAVLAENPLMIRPSSTGGSGSSMSVVLCSKR